jgi:hypothetical protein
LLDIVKNTLQIVKVSDINSKIIDAILFSIMSTIQILALNGFNVNNFTSKGKERMDFKLL